MTNFFDRFTGRKPNDDEASPAQSAKERLKLVLTTDRTQISPEDLRKMQAEIVEVVQRYTNIDDFDVDVSLELRDRENFLVANVPLKNATHNNAHRARPTQPTVDEPVIEESVDAYEDEPEPYASQEAHDDTEPNRAEAKGAPTGFHLDDDEGTD